LVKISEFADTTENVRINRELVFQTSTDGRMFERKLAKRK